MSKHISDSVLDAMPKAGPTIRPGRGYSRSSEFIPRYGLPRKKWWFDDSAHRASVRANTPRQPREARHSDGARVNVKQAARKAALDAI